MRLVVTAGFDKSKTAIAICEMLTRQGHEIDKVFVVTPINIKRLRILLYRGGLKGLKREVTKLFNLEKTSGNSPLKNYLIDNGIQHRSLKKWCNQFNVDFHTVKNLNNSKTLLHLKKAKPDVVVYAGGGILRKEFIDAANRNVINIHSGPLPEIRGMNAIEWAILLDERIETTIHFIDEGIDTGDIISRFPYNLDRNQSVNGIRDTAVVYGLKEIVTLFEKFSDLTSINRVKQDSSALHRQCYVMAPVIKEILERKLKMRI